MSGHGQPTETGIGPLSPGGARWHPWAESSIHLTALLRHSGSHPAKKNSLVVLPPGGQVGRARWTAYLTPAVGPRIWRSPTAPIFVGFVTRGRCACVARRSLISRTSMRDTILWGACEAAGVGMFHLCATPTVLTPKADWAPSDDSHTPSHPR